MVCWLMFCLFWYGLGVLVYFRLLAFAVLRCLDVMDGAVCSLDMLVVALFRWLLWFVWCCLFATVCLLSLVLFVLLFV